MISDAELLKLVMERYPEQPSAFIIEQFALFKAGLIQANNKLAVMDAEEVVAEPVNPEEPVQESADAPVSAAAPKKKSVLKRRSARKPWCAACAAGASRT